MGGFILKKIVSMQHALNILFYIKESKTIHTRKPQKFSLSQAPIKLNSFLFFVPFAIFIWDTQLQFLTILSSYFLCTTKRKSKIKLKDFHRFVNFFFFFAFSNATCICILFKNSFAIPMLEADDILLPR